MEYTVQPGQGLMDISIAASGSVAALFDIAAGRSITEELIPGAVLTINTSVLNKRVLDTYRQKNIIPGNAQILDDFVGEGVGYWAIEDDFIVM